MASANEISAMESAQGQVQQYGYEASWPSLVSIDNQPTYVMVLKDAAGVVRMYAMVNAESYNIVACDYTLDAVKSAYEKRMSEFGIKYDKDDQEMPDVESEQDRRSEIEEQVTDIQKWDREQSGFEAVVEKITFADDGGDTYVYIKCDDDKVYKARFDDDPGYLMDLSEGDTVAGSAYTSNENGVENVSVFDNAPSK